jgi:hypothetical protein
MTTRAAIVYGCRFVPMTASDDRTSLAKPARLWPGPVFPAS